MKFLLFLLISSTSFAFDSSQTLCPEPLRSELRGFEIDLVSIVDRWVPLLDASTERQAANASKVLQCTRRVLQKGLTYYCGKLPGARAKTYPMIGSIVYLDHEWFSDNFLDVRRGALLHEATHKCGTNDAFYFDYENKPKNVGISGWSIIASTYEYWLRRGFCIPPDC